MLPKKMISGRFPVIRTDGRVVSFPSSGNGLKLTLSQVSVCCCKSTKFNAIDLL
jgi:hypothetical protein